MNASNPAIAGFVVNGTSAKKVLVRGVGPTLGSFGVTGALIDPVISVYDSSQNLVGVNGGWQGAVTQAASSLGTSALATTTDMATVGAFPLNSGSADSAMTLTLSPGAYTMQIAGASADSGVVLAEVYELDSVCAQKFSNISTRCYVGTGSAAAICGVVVTGPAPRKVLVRAVGPTLGNFGITGVLEHPQLILADSSSQTIAMNSGWYGVTSLGNSTVNAIVRSATTSDMAAVGAFALSSGSADAAFVATLPPGSYTAQVIGADGGAGVALVEIYSLP